MFAGLCLAVIVFLLPETSRNIVGNGSVRPPTYLRLPVPTSTIMQHWQDNGEHESTQHSGRRLPNPLKSLKILLRKDNAVTIMAWGLMYAVYTCIIGTLSTLCIEIYGLNEWQAGLIYLPFGVGGIVSTFFSGKLLDNAYRRARTRRGLLTDMIKGDDLDTFPIEKARLSIMWIPMLATALCVSSYGWVLQLRLVSLFTGSKSCLLAWLAFIAWAMIC